jgi:hypothetical protein
MKAELSATSKRVYLERVKVLLQEHKTDIYDIITDPKKYIQWITNHYDSDQSRKAYLSGVLAIFRHNEGLKEQEKDAYLQWYRAFQEVHERIEERYKRNEPTEKQKAGYVPFEKIVEARDTLKKGSYERLLFALYTYLPPLRCDFNRVRIYKSHVPSSGDVEKNYIVLTSKDATLYLNEYKTKNKASTVYEKQFPEDLIKELRDSLEEYPRDWLFLDNNGNPFQPKSYTKWANRIFERVLKKKMTISMIRHAFINSLDFNKITVAEKEAIAKDMAHTVGTQDRYRLIFNKD